MKQRTTEASSSGRAHKPTLPLQLVRSSMHTGAAAAAAARMRSSADESDLSEEEDPPRRPPPARPAAAAAAPAPRSSALLTQTMSHDHSEIRSNPAKSLTRRPLALFGGPGSPILSAPTAEQPLQQDAPSTELRSELDEEFLTLEQIPRSAAVIESQSRATAAKTSRSHRPAPVVIPTDDSPDIDLTSPQVSAIPILPPITFEPAQHQQMSTATAAPAASPARAKPISTHRPAAAPAASAHAATAAASSKPSSAAPARPIEIVQLQFKSVAQRRREKQQTAPSAAPKQTEAKEEEAEMSDGADAEEAEAEQSAELGPEDEEDETWIVLDDTAHPYTAEEAAILRHSKRLPLSRIRMPTMRPQPAPAPAPPAKPKPKPKQQPQHAPQPQPSRKRKKVVVIESSSEEDVAAGSADGSNSEDSLDYDHLPPRHMLTRALRKETTAGADLTLDTDNLPQWKTRKSPIVKPIAKPAPVAAAAAAASHSGPPGSKLQHSQQTAAIASAHVAALIAGAADKPWEALWPIEQLLLSSPSCALEDMVSQWCKPNSTLYIEIIDSWTGREVTACCFHLGLEVEPKGAGATARMKKRLKAHLRQIARDYPELFTQKAEAATPAKATKGKGSSAHKRGRSPAQMKPVPKSRQAAKSDRSKPSRARRRGHSSSSSSSSSSSGSSSSSSSSESEGNSDEERQVQKRARVTRGGRAVPKPPAKRLARLPSPSPEPAPYDASRMPKVIDVNLKPLFRPWPASVASDPGRERSPAPDDPFAAPLTPSPSPPPQAKSSKQPAESPKTVAAAPVDEPMTSAPAAQVEETIDMTDAESSAQSNATLAANATNCEIDAAAPEIVSSTIDAVLAVSTAHPEPEAIILRPSVSPTMDSESQGSEQHSQPQMQAQHEIPQAQVDPAATVSSAPPEPAVSADEPASVDPSAEFLLPVAPAADVAASAVAPAVMESSAAPPFAESVGVAPHAVADPSVAEPAAEPEVKDHTDATAGAEGEPHTAAEEDKIAQADASSNATETNETSDKQTTSTAQATKSKQKKKRRRRY